MSAREGGGRGGEGKKEGGRKREGQQSERGREGGRVEERGAASDWEGSSRSEAKVVWIVWRIVGKGMSGEYPAIA